MFSPTHLLNPAAGVMIHFIPDKGAAQIFQYRGGRVSPFFSILRYFAHISEKHPYTVHYNTWEWLLRVHDNKNNVISDMDLLYVGIKLMNLLKN